MYDWNALWHLHKGYRTGYGAQQEDINALADELGAKRIKPAENHHDIAVYQADDHYILIGHGNGLQILTLARHAMFNIAIRFVGEGPVLDMQPPYIEVDVTNPATDEREVWRGAVRRDSEGRDWLEKQLLSEGIMPAMAFDALSFTDQARFRDLLYSSWQQALPRLQSEIAAWVPDAERETVSRARYQALVKHEQAVLSRLFSLEERQLINGCLCTLQLKDPQDCRGLWIKLETGLTSSDPAIDVEALLDKMRKLSFAQELALVESL